MSRYRDQVENILGDVKLKFDFEEGWTVEFNERQKRAIEFMRSVDKAAAKRGKIESRKTKNKWFCTFNLYDDVDLCFSISKNVQDLHMLYRYVRFVIRDIEEFDKYKRLEEMISLDYQKNSGWNSLISTFRKTFGLYPKE